MTVFIRFDVKGTFRGSEHVSTFGDEFEDGRQEAGISCYRFSDLGVKRLISYWMNHAGLWHIEEYADMNLTVFEGEFVGHGTDFEDCATCTKVLAEIDAAEFIAKYKELDDKYYDDELESEEEIYEILAKTIEEAIAK